MQRACQGSWHLRVNFRCRDARIEGITCLHLFTLQGHLKKVKWNSGRFIDGKYWTCTGQLAKQTKQNWTANSNSGRTCTDLRCSFVRPRGISNPATDGGTSFAWGGDRLVAISVGWPKTTATCFPVTNLIEVQRHLLQWRELEVDANEMQTII